MDCLSQGKLYTDEYNCGSLTQTIIGYRKAYKTLSIEKKTKEITLNEFLNIGASAVDASTMGDPVSIFRNNVYFLPASDEKTMPPKSFVYKHMFMVKDAKEETIYSNITGELSKKFPADTYKQFTRFNGTTIDETSKGEDGTIRTIKGTSYFVKNGTNACHKLFTLSYPNYDIIPAGNQLVDHRTLVYKIIAEQGLVIVDDINCLDELEDSRYINFSFNYADFMTAINFTNSDSIKPTVKEFKVSQLDAYSRNEDIPKDPNDK
jgi:hypothetical protein